MTDRELRKLNRTELLQILVDLSQENEMLHLQKNELEQRFEDRQIDLEELGSIADASLKVSGIFQAAQEAVDIYLDNVKRVHGIQKRSDSIIAETKQKCADMETACKRRCDEYIQKAKCEADAQWMTLKARLDKYCDAHEHLRDQLVNLYNTPE